MKLLVFSMVAFLLLASCDKEDICDPQKVPCEFCSQRDTATFKTNRYYGSTHLIIPGHTNIVNNAYRELFQYSNVYVVRWCTAPDSVGVCFISDTLHYRMTYDQSNNSCGIQRTIYDYIVTSFRISDSIFEYGTVRYRWFYNHSLVTDLSGTFVSKLRYVDILTPNRNSYKP